MRVFNSLGKSQRQATHCSSLAALDIFTAVCLYLTLPLYLICSLEFEIYVQAEMAHLFNPKQMDFSYLLFRSIKGPPTHSLLKGTSTNFRTLESAVSQKFYFKNKSYSSKIVPSQGSLVWKVMPWVSQVTWFRLPQPKWKGTSISKWKCKVENKESCLNMNI